MVASDSRNVMLVSETVEVLHVNPCLKQRRIISDCL
jgi:hypothetical protein